MVAGKTPRVTTDFQPITADDFQARTGIDFALLKSTRGLEGLLDTQWIVSPRDIQKVSGIIAMPDFYRNILLGSIGMAYDQDRKVYKDCEIHMWMTDTSSLVLGQKFVYRKNYISIVEGFRHTFKGFGLTRGFAILSAQLILGTIDDTPVLAQYLPPIVERHGSDLVLMDGVHRSYLARQAGVSIACLWVKNVKMTFPCTPHYWIDVEVVDEKPPRVEDRYWDLDRGLFRDLKYVGIDG